MSVNNIKSVKNAIPKPEIGESLSLSEAVSQSLATYFEHLGEQEATNLYQLVLNEVEPALLKSILERTEGNQSRAALALGLNRGTFRKKLKNYGID